MTADPEIEENWKLVRTALGEQWSGRTRYAAAAFFFRHAMMNAEVLEAYRILSRLDGEDPVAFLNRNGIGREWIKALQAEP